MNSSSSPIWKALHEAFPCTIPIFAGFWFIAFAYGFYMYTLGFSFIYPTLMAMFIFGGSLEFVTVSMLLSSFAPWQTLVVALTVQARHLFYGLAMLEKYRGTGWKKPFLIFWMCDESFALNYSATIPYDVDRGWYYFWVSFLDYTYWVSGAMIGGLLGSLVSFDTKGLSFVMTTMFLVVFLEQWLKEGKHYTALIGLAASILSLLFFGKDAFIIPAMAGMLLVLTLLRKPIEKAGGIFMTFMPLWQQIATIALCVLGTMTTRFLPFLIFKPGSRLPGYVKYLGKALPSAVFALLVVYCLKDVSLLSGSHGIPEALGMGLTALLHLWRRQMLLSMAGGTLFYMFLVQYIF